MPIYSYRCSSCGLQKDVLQKMSDPLLTVCPACGAATFQKQVTAAGFQLKGSGWYVTDFRGGSKGPGDKADKPDNGTAEPGEGGAGAKGAETPAAAKSADAGAAAAPATAAPAPGPAPAPAATPSPAASSAKRD